MLQDYLDRSPVSQHLNTAFIERHNGTMRHQNRRFTRKTWGFSKKDEWMVRQLVLSLGYYHFCWAHGGLREEIKPPLPTKGSGSPKKWKEITPMMSIGVADHKWTLEELLTFRVPPTIDSIVNTLSVKFLHKWSGFQDDTTASNAKPGMTTISRNFNAIVTT
jgi:hypothetical protein